MSWTTKVPWEYILVIARAWQFWGTSGYPGSTLGYPRVPQSTPGAPGHSGVHTPQAKTQANSQEPDAELAKATIMPPDEAATQKLPACEEVAGAAEAEISEPAAQVIAESDIAIPNREQSPPAKRHKID